MRVGFAGTPAFAVTALAAIADAGFTIPLVLTRPDKPKGRGLKIEPSPVSEEAQRRGLQVLQPATLKTPEGRAQALAVPLDVLAVAAYGLILPPEVLAWPRHGCLNIHASKLPRWRGAAPFYTSKPDGLGLGLVSVKLCAEAHGGSVEVFRSDLGGAAFRVRLPRAAKES